MKITANIIFVMLSTLLIVVLECFDFFIFVLLKFLLSPYLRIIIILHF